MRADGLPSTATLQDNKILAKDLILIPITCVLLRTSMSSDLL